MRLEPGEGPEDIASPLPAVADHLHRGMPVRLLVSMIHRDCPPPLQSKIIARRIGPAKRGSPLELGFGGQRKSLPFRICLGLPLGHPDRMIEWKRAFTERTPQHPCTGSHGPE